MKNERKKGRKQDDKHITVLIQKFIYMHILADDRLKSYTHIHNMRIHLQILA